MANNEKLKEFGKQISSEIRLLSLDKIGVEWANAVISNDFLQCEDLPLTYEEHIEDCNLKSRLKNIHKICLMWLEENEKQSQETGTPTIASTTLKENLESESSQCINIAQATSSQPLLWSFLIQEEKLDLQSLIALLGYLIDKGNLLTSSTEDRERCFVAANLYLILICIPGSMAFRIYHQMLYLKTLQLNQLFITVNKKRKNAAISKKSQSKQSSFHETDANEEEFYLSDKDISIIEKKMTGFLDCVSQVAQKLSFRRYPNILKETIESMLPIISLGLGSISVQALEIVQFFCNPLHGDAIQTVHYIFLHILPYLALDPNEKDLNNKELITLKDISFRLVKSFICKFGPSIYSLVQGLIQHVCIDVVDRAEYRQKTAQTALDLLDLLPEDHQKNTIRWFLLLAHNEQASLRLFTMEIFALLLQRDQISVLTLAVIFGQCSDASSSVRAKALFIFGECIESKHHTMVEIFNTIFSSELHQTLPTDREEIDLLDILQEEEVEISPTLLPSATAVLGLLKERAIDDKVYVRKSALQLLLTLVKRNRQLLSKDILKLLGDSCMDVALLIRRHMAQMLTDLVALHQDHSPLKNVWVRSVLPLVMDRENRVQEKTFECLDQLIFKCLVDDGSMLGWSLLEIITEQGLVSYLSKAVETFTRQKMLSPCLIKVLLHNTEQHAKAALTLLAIISRHTSPGSNVKKFALSLLQKPLSSANSLTVNCMQQVYKILGCSVPSMDQGDRESIRSVLSQQIESFSLSTELISAACDLVVFCIQQESEDEEVTRKKSMSWATTVLSTCGEYLSANLRKQESVQPDEEELLARHIYTLGCVALHCPWNVNKRHFLMIQHAAFQPENGADIPIPCSQTQPTRKLPERLQAAAVISLGKLGVQHEEKAKQLVPGLGKLLETTPHETIRNNIVCILCDWVVRYATAIDPVIPQVTACLRDPNPVVRKQTLVLLIHLLQEDYLKIRGTFFFRILQLTCDDDESLSDLALFYVTQRLLHRQSNIIQQHFIESIFHFNDYRGHPSFNKFALTDRERKLFSIAGPSHSKRRFQIYIFMLQNLDDEARFQLTFRLSRDILFGVVEGVMPLKNSSTEAVLKDALAILASDDIKLASLKTTEEDPVDKEDIAQAIVQSTKKAIIAQVVKRNVIENIIPIVMELKRKLASLKSPLMGDLMQFLRELMKDYKNEIQEVLAADRQLMAEIEFDLKRFEQQEQSEASRQNLRVEPLSPVALEDSRTELENPPRKPSPKSVSEQDLPNELPKSDLPNSDLPNSDLPNSDLPNSDLPNSDLPNEIDEPIAEPNLITGTDIAPELPSNPVDKEIMSDNQPGPSADGEPKFIAPSVAPSDGRSTTRGRKGARVLRHLDPPAMPIMLDPRPELIAPTTAEPAAVISDPPSTRRRKRENQHQSNSSALPNTTTTLPSNQPIIMSTPIKANAELTFNINDAEMSIIPHADPKKNKRRRL